jgi:ABC-type transport system involved in multi-copper enzyme maturation permease subunit
LRKFSSILKATALEILSEPLSLLLLLAALAMTVLAPAFHYHQFGEATRMARDAGFSALFTCGSALAVFGTIRAFRREVESGTLEMALAHPVSHGGFFFAKTAGAAVAYLVFALVVFGTHLAIVWGAAAGGYLAQQTGDVASVYGPALAAGVAVILLPLVVAAALNRFARFRFVLTAFALALLLALLFGGAAFAFAPRLLLPYPPVAFLVALPAMILLAAAAAFAVRFKSNAAASAVGLVFAAMIPVVGNYYLSDALTKGGSVSLFYVAGATAAAVPAILAFLLLGATFLKTRA